jgi:capsular exopolysaccharide synthesis family protein
MSASPLTLLRRARLDALHHVARACWFNAWMILLVLGLSLAAAALYISSTPVLYRLAAAVPLGADPVVAAETLPEFRDLGWAKSSLLQDKAFVSQSIPAHLGYQADDFASRLEVTDDPAKKTIFVAIEDRYPKNARLALEALLQAYSRHLDQEITQRRDAIMTQLVQDLAALRTEMTNAEKNYREVLNSMVGSDTALMGEGKLEPLLPKLEAAFEAARKEEEKWRLAYESVAGMEGNAPALLEFPDIANHSSILFVRNRIREQQALLETIRTANGPDHPAVAQVSVRLQEQEKVLEDTALQFPGLLKGRMERAVAQREEASARLEKHRADIETLRQQGRDPETLARVLGDKRAVYAGTSSRLQELQAEAKVGAEKPGSIPFSFLPEKEIRLPAARILAWTGGIALAVGLFLAWIFFVISPKVRTIEEVERAAEIRVLAAVPRDASVGRTTVRNLSENRPDSAAAEALRTLRSVVVPQMETSTGAQIILLTGAKGEEGVSCSAVHLAASCAGSGLKTLLVDLNLRHPNLSGMVLGSAVLPGVSDYALGIDSLDQLVRPVGDRLDLLPAGRAVPNPGELMGYPWFQNFAEEVRNRYQVVILDGAPVLRFGDILPTLPQLDRVVLVARASRTSILHLTKAARQILESGGALEGVLLNQVRSARTAQ